MEEKTLKQNKIIYPKTSYKLFPNAHVFLDDLEKEIKKAKSKIDLQFFTFEADTIGKKVAKTLFKARERGISVRFIIDRYIDASHNTYWIRKPRFNRKLHRSIIDEWKETKKLIEEMKINGIEVKRVNPLGLFFRKALIRDHKKIVVIDSDITSKSVAYIGGTNLAEHNISWNDFMVKMSGDMIPVIQEDFDMTWEDRNEGREIKYSDGVVLSDSRKFVKVLPYIIDLIDSARNSVIIESPYLHGKNIRQSLIDAAHRDIKVSVVVPLHNNKRFFAPNGRYLKPLRSSNIHIYQFVKNGGMTHAKALLVDDDTVVFGSSNFNEFTSGRMSEINIATKNKDLIRQMKEKLDSDMKSSQIKD